MNLHKVVDTPETDLELIDQANKGKEMALSALYHKHKSWVYSQAYRICQNHDDSLDVTQEVFRYFFNKFPGFKLTCQLTTFLFPVARNQALNLVKKKRRLELSNELKEEGREDLKLHERLENFHEHLGELSEEHRDVVVLRFADELSMDEIAEALDIPKGTVKSRLHNALKKLRASKI